MKTKTYTCICGKEFTKSNSLQNTCGKVKCKLELDKQKRLEKSKKLSITIQGLSKDESRREIRSKLEEFMPLYLENKKVTIKVSKGTIKTRFKHLKDKLDKVFAEFIRLRDNNTCVICGSMENPNNGHYFSRVCSILRYNEINCNCQCAKCNFKHEQDEKPYTDWMNENYGSLIVNELRLSYYGKPTKLSDEYLEMKIEHYMKEIKKLKDKF